MEPFVLTAGSSEVNGTYSFAKSISGVYEYWFVRKIKKRKKIIDKIYKIRGGGYLPQFGNQFNICWILQHSSSKDQPPIQYYAAPMKSKYDKLPPNNGWICIGGIDPTPNIAKIDLISIKKQFDQLKPKMDGIKNTIGDLKKDKKNKPSNCPALKSAIAELNAIKPAYELYEYQLKCSRGMVRKAWNEIRLNLDLVSQQEFFYCRSADIYGGCAGLYDFGPIGASIKNNILQEWRQHFIITDRMLQIESCMMTPKPVLEASGHVAKFSDFIVKDVKTGQPYRADHLLENYIDKLLEEKSLNMTADEIAKHKQIRENADSYNQNEITDLIMNIYKIKAPETGNDITPPEEFNLMFSSQIGPTGKTPGFLRPETAQGIFTNFDKLLKQNYGKMPFAVAQIGHSFRNEIAPRGGLIRVREFQMAEIEHFCEKDVRKNEYPKFKFVKNVKMRFLPSENQTGDDDNTIVTTIGAACNLDKNINPLPSPIENTTLGYYLARTQLFFKRIGIDTKNKLRFRQHKKTEMAHYAQDCWDAEILTSMGWIECVGHADRACYDLNQHSAASGKPLDAVEIFDKPKTVIKIHKKINKKLLYQTYKQNTKQLQTYLESLSDDDAKKLNENIQKSANGEFIIKICDAKIDYKLTNKMFSITENQINVSSEKYVPSVVEPSFGIGRILYALLEHNIWERIDDEHRIVLSLKPRIAPYKVAILPISNQLYFIAEQIESLLSGQQINVVVIDDDKQINDNDQKYDDDDVDDDDDDMIFNDGIATYIDESSTNIGKKYARCDQKGIPFAVTIDFQTQLDETVTVRERDTTIPQIRVKINDLYNLMESLSVGRIKWKNILNKYPHHTQQRLS